MPAEYILSDISKLKNLLDESKNIVITCHLSPDGDALGSSLGLKRILENYKPTGKVDVVTPDEPTKTLAFLPGFNTITAFSHFPQRVAALLRKADVVFCLDFNALSRIDKLAPSVEKSSAKKILIDHHTGPEAFTDITFSYPAKCSTCLLLYQLMVAADMTRYIDAGAADCLLTGMMTDTGDFSYNVEDPGIYVAIGGLIEKGADKSRLTRLLFNTFSESNLRIQGYALAQKMEVFYDEHAALICIDRAELNRFNYKKGDTEGLVNKPLAIPGILYSCFLREETDYIKVSMRSLGDIPVNKICGDYFNGGGHLNAAGGEFYGTMDECANIFRNILSENKRKYIDDSICVKKILKEETENNQSNK